MVRYGQISGVLSKVTGNDVRFPFHISYLWKDGKIIEEVQFFSTKVFDTENEAKNNQLK